MTQLTVRKNADSATYRPMAPVLRYARFSADLVLGLVLVLDRGNGWVGVVAFQSGAAFGEGQCSNGH